ncbi:phospholipase A2, minor isoenzyme-like [Pelobates fuscus]|uniref:phospholipase A2, minor isoenzyme-like n=1 Tax=Pelobates fuscus TaxID=191477 RepID=UPI002FE46B99
MKSCTFLILTFAILLESKVACHEKEILARDKRGVLDLVVTLWCYRNKMKVPLLGINLYGCYCGTGGSGFPVDEVDRCCFLHDCCYYHSRIVLKCHTKVKWEFYNFSCSRDQTNCTSSNVCGRTACECDKQFAECLTQARPKGKHFFYNRKTLCNASKDVCPPIFMNGTETFHGTQNSSHKKVERGKRKSKYIFTKQKNKNKKFKATQKGNVGFRAH